MIAGEEIFYDTTYKNSVVAICH